MHTLCQGNSSSPISVSNTSGGVCPTLFLRVFSSMLDLDKVRKSHDNDSFTGVVLYGSEEVHVVMAADEELGAQNSLLTQEDLRIEVSFLIADVTRNLRALYDVEMGHLGLSRAQWRALIFILRLNSPTQTDLAEALDIGRASIGSLIDQLEKSGFAARIMDPNDRRVWRVVPTRVAHASATSLNDAALKVVTRAFDSLPDQDISSLFETLTQIRKNLA